MGFGECIVREQQISKVRYEIVSTNPDGSHRKIADMFGLIESKKQNLRIEEYSISQTSLEQIFNQFASTQEEEEGQAVPLVADPELSGATGSNPSSGYSYNKAASDDLSVQMREAGATRTGAGGGSRS